MHMTEPQNKEKEKDKCCHRCWCTCFRCRHKPIHIQSIQRNFKRITFENEQKYVVYDRMVDLLYEYHDRSCRYSSSFHTLRVVITIGSLIVPALLSVQYMDGQVSPVSATMSSQVYWTVWVLSLLVTMSNGIMTLLKIDKKHFVMNTTFQHLLSECWQFIELSGRYSVSHDGNQNNHDQQFLAFCHMLEKIRMKQVQDEYFKVPEQDQKAPATNELMPFSPPSGNFSKAKVNGDAPLPATSSGSSQGKTTTTIRRQNSQKEGVGFLGTAFETETIPKSIVIAETIDAATAAATTAEAQFEEITREGNHTE